MYVCMCVCLYICIMGNDELPVRAWKEGQRRGWLGKGNVDR